MPGAPSVLTPGGFQSRRSPAKRVLPLLCPALPRAGLGRSPGTGPPRSSHRRGQDGPGGNFQVTGICPRTVGWHFYLNSLGWNYVYKHAGHREPLNVIRKFSMTCGRHPEQLCVGTSAMALRKRHLTSRGLGSGAATPGISAERLLRASASHLSRDGTDS